MLKAKNLYEEILILNPENISARLNLNILFGECVKQHVQVLVPETNGHKNRAVSIDPASSTGLHAPCTSKNYFKVTKKEKPRVCGKRMVPTAGRGMFASKSEGPMNFV